MALMAVTEYAALAQDAKGHTIMVGKEPAIIIQSITYTGTAGNSVAFNSLTNFVRINLDAKGAVAFGAAAVAVATDTPMAADVPEYFGVGNGDRVSAITRVGWDQAERRINSALEVSMMPTQCCA